MIIAMQLGATDEQIDHICDRVREFGYAPHVIRGAADIASRQPSGRRRRVSVYCPLSSQFVISG